MRKKYVLFFPYNYIVRGFADIGQSRHQVKFFFNFRKTQKKLFSVPLLSKSFRSKSGIRQNLEFFRTGFSSAYGDNDRDFK